MSAIPNRSSGRLVYSTPVIFKTNCPVHPTHYPLVGSESCTNVNDITHILYKIMPIQKLCNTHYRPIKQLHTCAVWSLKLGAVHKACHAKFGTLWPLRAPFLLSRSASNPRLLKYVTNFCPQAHICLKIITQEKCVNLKYTQLSVYKVCSKLKSILNRLR